MPNGGSREAESKYKMKKHLHNSLRALCLSLAVLLSLPVLAIEVEIDGINYDLVAKAKQATVIKKSSGEYYGEVVIPESVVYEGTAYSVTSIGDYVFYACYGLTSVTIPNSVTSIGEEAFYGCFALLSVTIGNGVTSIGSEAFEGCSALTSVTIGNSVTSIGNSAFNGCKGLTSVTIPNSVTSIGDRAFWGCSGLTSVTIGNSVTSIGDYAFWSCSGLTSVTIPNSVTSIGEEAFDGCSGLTSVHISDIIAWCNIEFGDSDSNPLCYAHHLYLNGEEVKDLVIPNSVTSIGDYAFYWCSGLTSVTIPNSVTSIGDDAFGGCSGLTSVTIPNSVTNIGDYAFGGCSGLTSVTIPNSVTSIGEATFYGCSGLTSVTIPNSVESIGDWAFSSCSGLTSVSIPNSVESIGSYAFAYCSELLDVYCYAENVPSTYSNAFDGSYPEYATLHVPDASIDSYKATEPWSRFGKIVGLSGGEPEQPEVEKCATPVVTYVDGCLEITCETEGAEFITDIADNDIKKHYGSKIELSATYNIEVFATKANCENSDTVSVALVWVENGDTDVEAGIISVEAAPVLIQGNGGVLSVSGVAKDTEVVVYTISGTEVVRATATDGTATISTGLQSGTIVVVKFGNKSVKVRI